MADTAKVLDMIKEHDVKYVDFRFTDPRGKWQHLAHHVRTISEDFLNDGVMFDGSSIAGWKAINESDMMLVPDCATAVLDPFAAQTSLIVFCDVHEPLTGQPYGRDPRSIAKKAEQYLVSTGIGDTAYFGPEAEFFIFDDVRYRSTMNGAMYEIDSEEGPYVTRQEVPRRQHRPPPADQGRLFPGAAGRRPERSARRDAVGDDRHGAQGRKAPPRGGAEPGRARRSSSTPWCAPPTTCRSTNTSCTTSRTSTARRRPSCRSRSRATTARACTSTSRCGRASGRSSPATSTPICRRRRSTTSAASSGTPRRSTPSPTRRRTATSG